MTTSPPRPACQCDAILCTCSPCPRPVSQEDFLCDPCRAWKNRRPGGPPLLHCHRVHARPGAGLAGLPGLRELTDLAAHVTGDHRLFRGRR